MTFLISTGAVYHKALFSGQHPQHISMKVLQGKVKKDQVYGILSLINTQSVTQLTTKSELGGGGGPEFDFRIIHIHGEEERMCTSPHRNSTKEQI
ncbi:hypothetical protein AAZX31_06G206600 [Glycine max]|nr:hypothetical protein GYH30_015881 [Glycine max]